MDLFRNTADFIKLAGNDTFMYRKTTAVYFGDSFEIPLLKKGNLGGFSNGDKKTHLVPLVQREDFRVLN
jgi:hypothetical protein